MAYKIGNKHHDNIIKVCIATLNKTPISELEAKGEGLQNFSSKIREKLTGTLKIKFSGRVRHATFINGNLVIGVNQGQHFQIDSHLWQNQQELSEEIRGLLKSKTYQESPSEPTQISTIHYPEIAEAS